MPTQYVIVGLMVRELLVELNCGDEPAAGGANSRRVNGSRRHAPSIWAALPKQSSPEANIDEQRKRKPGRQAGRRAVQWLRARGRLRRDVRGAASAARALPRALPPLDEPDR